MTREKLISEKILLEYCFNINLLKDWKCQATNWALFERLSIFEYNSPIFAPVV